MEEGPARGRTANEGDRIFHAPKRRHVAIEKAVEELHGRYLEGRLSGLIFEIEHGITNMANSPPGASG